MPLMHGQGLVVVVGVPAPAVPAALAVPALAVLAAVAACAAATFFAAAAAVSCLLTYLLRNLLYHLW